MSVSEGQKERERVIFPLKLKSLAVKESIMNGHRRKVQGKACSLLDTMILCDKVQHFASLMTFISRHANKYSASLNYAVW